MTDILVHRHADLDSLGPRWRALEELSHASFFQSWTWTGCLMRERFPDPVLVEAKSHGRTVALGLFNRRRRRLWLGEHGSPERDCPYIEQNGILAEAGREAELTAACLGALSQERVVLSAVESPVLAAARQAAGLVLVRQAQASPRADLRAGAEAYLSARSANTRSQLRRSDRWYTARGAGAAIEVTAAQSTDEALLMLEEMASLHQLSWTRRNQPGSFARPFFRRFHHALIQAGLPAGQIALLRISCGGTIIGILYNFVYRGRMLAYQSGFAYDGAGGAAKPGLTCHHAAIRHAASNGLQTYDFLAGEDRYKRSLSDSAEPMFWLEAGPRLAPALLAATLVQAARRSADRCRQILHPHRHKDGRGG